MPDTLMVPSVPVANGVEERALTDALVREVALGRRPRRASAARPVAKTLADALDELERDLARLRRRCGAPPSAGGRIRLAVAEAALLGGYARDVADALAGLRGAGARVVSVRSGERGMPPCMDGGVVLRLTW